MSNNDGMRVWVGELDDYIDVDEINRWNEQEAVENALRDDLDSIGDLPLLDGRKTNASALNSKGIKPNEWRWAVHEAEKSFSGPEKLRDLEGSLIQGLLAVGRPYAVGRYARWERLTLASARTAVLPFGHLALIDQHLARLDPTGAPDARRAVRAAIKKAEAAEGLVAYERTAIIRMAILNVFDIESIETIDRERLRTLLSLTRLRFSATEANIRSFDQLRALDDFYAAARRKSATTAPNAPADSQSIQNWNLRFMHPLTFLMPIAIRAALDRGSRHLTPRWSMSIKGSPQPNRIERLQAVNELALAKCATILIRRTARQR